MTIEFTNNGKTVTVEYDEEFKGWAIKTAKDIKVTPKQLFEVDTKLSATFSHTLDELVIVNDDNDMNYISVVSDWYADFNEGEEARIVLVVFYNGEKNTTIKAGTTLAYAKCYHRCDETSPYSLPQSDVNKPIMYVDDDIRVQSLKGVQIPIEICTDPDGSTYLKVALKGITEPAESEKVNE